MKIFYFLALVCIFFRSQVTADLLDGLDHHDHHDDDHDHDDHDEHFDDLDFRDDHDDHDDDDFEGRLLKQINTFLPSRDFTASKPKSLRKFGLHSDEEIDFKSSLSQLIPDPDYDDDDKVIVVDIDFSKINAPKFNFQPPPRPITQRKPLLESNFELPAIQRTPVLLNNFLPNVQNEPTPKFTVIDPESESRPFGIIPETNGFEINKPSLENFFPKQDDEEIVVVLKEPLPQREFKQTNLAPQKDLDAASLALDNSHNDFDYFSDNSIGGQGRQLEHEERPTAPNSFDLLDGEYPTFAVVPRTSFDCSDQDLGGYYADLEADCQVFHICLHGGLMGSFLCPNGTLFNQKHFVCDWWFNVDCSQSPQNYILNARIGVVPDDSFEYYDEK